MVLGSVSKTSSIITLGLLSATFNKCSSAVSDSWGVGHCQRGNHALNLKL